MVRTKHHTIDQAAEDNEGTLTFASVYYRRKMDAKVGYGGEVVYTRDAQLPELLLQPLHEAAKRIKFDFEKNFTTTGSSCARCWARARRRYCARTLLGR